MRGFDFLCYQSKVHQVALVTSSHPDFRAFSLCPFGGIKIALNLTFLVCLKLALYFFTPVRMLLSEKFGIYAKNQEAGSKP